MSVARLLTLALLAAAATGCQATLTPLEQPAPPREQQPVVDELEIDGVHAVADSAVRGVMVTHESSVLPWKEPARFDRQTLDADLQRITDFYADQGYPHARVVTADVTPRDNGRSVAIHIVVNEGEPVIVADVAFAGFEALPDDTMDHVRAAARVKRGQPLVRADLLATVQIAAEALRNEGYAYADINPEQTEIGPDRMRVVLRATPGPQAYFGAIDVSGNQTVDDEVIRRYLTYRPGERFRASAIRDSQRRLYSLGLFQLATIEMVNRDQQPAEVRTRVTVTEQDHRQVDFALGYGTEQKLSGEVELRNLNFLGGARSARVHGKWSWLDRGVEGSFTQPYLFRRALSLNLQGHAWFDDENAYRVLSRGGHASIAYAAGSQTQINATYLQEFESSRISNEALLDLSLRDQLIALGLNPTTGEQDGLLAAIQLDVNRDTTGSPLEPRTGYRGALHVEQAGGWLPGSFNYYNVNGDGRLYRTMGGVTFAERVRYGSILPMGPRSDVPFFKRYFLGGADSLRGWGRYQVSPLSGFGLPIGGYSMFVASAEARFPIAGSVGGVLLADAGKVWDDSWRLTVGDLLYDTGVGIRYQSPFGPLRLDFAYQLTPLEGLRVEGEPQRRRWRVHFNIGQAF